MSGFTALELVQHASTASRTANAQQPDQYQSNTHTAPSSDAQSQAQPPLTKPQVSQPTQPQNAITNASSPSLPRESISESWWLAEAFALIVSLLSFLTIFILLVIFNNRPLQDWHSRLSLNTIVSVSAIISRSALVAPVTSGLSQLKWLCYEKPSGQHLSKFQLFDEASRGPWGGLRLALRSFSSPLVALGASIMVTTLAFEPFVQQSVTYPVRNVTIGAAKIPKSNFFDGLMDSSFMVASYDAMLGFNLSKTASAITPTCSTGNCSFPDYLSLAFCSKCVDVSASLSVIPTSVESARGLDSLLCLQYVPANASSTEGICPPRIEAPNGLSLDYVDADLDQTTENGLSILNSTVGPLISNQLDAYVSTYPAVSNFSVIARAVPKPVAFDCVLSACAKQYSGEVRDGVFTERAQRSFYNMSQAHGWPYERVDPVPGGPTTLTFNITTTVPANSSSLGKDEVFDVSYESLGRFGFFLEWSFAGYIVSTLNYPDGTFQASFPSTDYIQGLWEHDMAKAPESMDTLATAWTNDMRLRGLSIPGEAMGGQTFIHVQFLWLILPFALELLALVFLLGTIICNARRGVPTWKSSALAMVFHGPEMSAYPMAIPWLETSTRMDKYAATTKASLTDDHGYLRLNILPVTGNLVSSQASEESWWKKGLKGVEKALGAVVG